MPVFDMPREVALFTIAAPGLIPVEVFAVVSEEVLDAPFEPLKRSLWGSVSRCSELMCMSYVQ